MDWAIEKKTLDADWIEYRIVMPAPERTGDFALTGSAARARTSKLVLTLSAGIAASANLPRLSAWLHELWLVISRQELN